MVKHGGVVVSKHLFVVLCMSDCEEVFVASEWRRRVPELRKGYPS